MSAQFGSVLMGFAIVKRQRTTNPCTDVVKLSVKRRRRYLTHVELRFILMGLLLGTDNRPTPSGPMMVCFTLFAYLTGLRMKDIRELRWSQLGETFITVQPTKTREATAATWKSTSRPTSGRSSIGQKLSAR